MTSDSSLFVDTNVLIYATNELSPWHRVAAQLLETAWQDGDVVVSPQVLREYLAAGTRLAGAGSHVPREQVMQNVRTFQGQFRLVEDTPSVMAALIKLVESVDVAGKQVHDANIVATMQVHGFKRLLTGNVADFARFGQLITVVPLEAHP